MAKVSKKPPRVQSGVDAAIFGEFVEAGIICGPETATHVPCVDVYTSGRDVVIEVEIPGVKKEDIDVSFLNDTLTIKAVKCDCIDEERGSYVCMERSFGKVLRSVELPFPVNSACIKASYKNGVLTVRVPKVDDKRRLSRKVEVETA